MITNQNYKFTTHVEKSAGNSKPWAPERSMAWF